MVNDWNADTEFNDALRAQGIIPPKAPSRSPSPDIPHITHKDAVHAIASTSDPTTLTTLLEGDGLDSDDERMFEEYKRKRIQEMRAEEKRGRFGSMMPLGREDFVREVTEGSRLNEEGVLDPEDGAAEEDDEDEAVAETRERNGGELKGTGVVVFLFKDSIPLSQHLRPLLNRLAAAHPSTKFLSIPADLCIPNYPDRNVPTLLVYRNGDMVGNIVAGMGLKGLKTTVRDLEMLLIRYKAMSKPSPALRPRQDEDDDSDFEGMDDDRENVVGTVNAKPGGLRGAASGGRRKPDSDESDLDL